MTSNVTTAHSSSTCPHPPPDSNHRRIATGSGHSRVCQTPDLSNSRRSRAGLFASLHLLTSMQVIRSRSLTYSRPRAKAGGVQARLLARAWKRPFSV